MLLSESVSVNRARPEVLRIRWRIYAMAKKWDACLEVARGLKTIDPEHRFGWLHEAMSLEQLDRPVKIIAISILAIQSSLPIGGKSLASGSDSNPRIHEYAVSPIARVYQGEGVYPH